jgi:hypothetical protein
MMCREYAGPVSLTAPRPLYPYSAAPARRALPGAGIACYTRRRHAYLRS